MPTIRIYENRNNGQKNSSLHFVDFCNPELFVLRYNGINGCEPVKAISDRNCEWNEHERRFPLSRCNFDGITNSNDFVIKNIEKQS